MNCFVPLISHNSQLLSKTTKLLYFDLSVFCICILSFVFVCIWLPEQCTHFAAVRSALNPQSSGSTYVYCYANTWIQSHASTPSVFSVCCTCNLNMNSPKTGAVLLFSPLYIPLFQKSFLYVSPKRVFQQKHHCVRNFRQSNMTSWLFRPLKNRKALEDY